MAMPQCDTPTCSFLVNGDIKMLFLSITLSLYICLYVHKYVQINVCILGTLGFLSAYGKIAPPSFLPPRPILNPSFSSLLVF